MTLSSALPGAAVAAALALTAAATPARRGPAARVELELAGILPMHEGAASIIVLREKGGRTLLPLFVAGADPGTKDPRASELVGSAIEALGGRVAEVEIDRAEESRGGARVKLSQGARRVELRARPSESVALALAAKVPIVTTRRLLEQAGLSPEDLERAHRVARGGETRM